jgi:hypothetical protein
MASKNIFLTERGFGSSRHGEATVIAGPNGEPLTLRTVITPNKAVGGQLTIVPLLERDEKRSTSDINTKEEVYEIKIVRNTAAMSGGTVRIKKIDAKTMSVQMYEVGFTENSKGAVQFIESIEMEGSLTAKTLLNDLLFNAFNAAMNRASVYRPDKLFYGKQATDVAPIEKKWFDKTLGKEVEERPKHNILQEVSVS